MKETKTMRDAFIGEIYNSMHKDDKIFFLSADMGAPALDKVREGCKGRFLNVGIAEQNLINVATGLALEGFTVYVYAIAAFVMRAAEQIRINLSLSSEFRDVNVNIIGVGAGASYDVSGPTHHCFEDISVMNTFPNMIVFSPSDWSQAAKFVDFSIRNKKPKYIRMDGKPLPRIYDENTVFDWEKGFMELQDGDDVCIIATGYMTHRALRLAEKFKEKDVNAGVVDIFLLKPANADVLFDAVKKYKHIITMEEAFTGKGGLDSIVMNMLNDKNSDIRLKSFGFKDKHLFEFGSREHLYSLSNFSDENILKKIHELSS